jgi:4-diphosphocytidyl-2-C-methyl-D-erythritol kinase
MIRTISGLAPAKINLFLRVIGRRSDGYHELDSLFMPVALYDQVRISLKPSSRFLATVRTNRSELPTDERNLALRAAQCIAERYGVHAEVNIELDKRIPLSSGLGGGSSDAGAVIRLLATALGIINQEELLAAALSIGADVPFFLDPRPARIGGIGEKIMPLPAAPQLELVVAAPPFEVSTARVYAQLKPTHWSGRAADTDVERFCAGELLSPMLVNDLARPACELYPAIEHLWRLVEDLQPIACGMSGSGGTIFAVYPDAQTAERARKHILRLDPTLTAIALRTIPSLPHSN